MAAHYCDVCGAPADEVGHGAVMRAGYMREYEHIKCTNCDRQWQVTSDTSGPDVSDLEFDGDDAL